MVIGHLKPVILIPAGLLTGLPAAQIEAILLHELAHIRRHDYAVNILQVIMESVFFFNPGLLWLSALLRDERENCCDDIALTQTQNKIEFVQALIGFKEHALNKMYPAVAFPGGKNQLVKRVSRILGHQSPAMAPVEKRSFITCVLIFCAFIATALVGNVKKANNKGFLKSRHVPVLLNYTSADMSRRSLNKTRSLQKYKQITDKRKIVDIALLKPGEQFKTFKAIHANIRTAVPSITNQFFAAPRLSPEQPVDLEEEQNKKDQEQAVRDQEQAKIDQELASRDQQQALRYQAIAAKQQEQAKVDMIQSKADLRQAGLDLQQARKDRAQAKSDRAQAIRDQQQAGTSDKSYNSITTRKVNQQITITTKVSY